MLLADLKQARLGEVEKRLSGLGASEDVAVLWLTLAIITRENDPAAADARFAKGIEILGRSSSVPRQMAQQIGAGRASFKEINDLALEPFRKAVLMVAIAQRYPGERVKFLDQAKRLKARFLGWNAGAPYLDVESLLDPIIARLTADTTGPSRKQ
jgi:hypothetical protein